MATLEQIQKYIDNNKKSDTVDIKFGDDFTLTAKRNLTELEKKAIVDSVVHNSYIGSTLSPVDTDSVFDIRFAHFVCPEFPVQLTTNEDGEEIIDQQATSDLIRGTDFITKYMDAVRTDLYYELESYIRESIEFENAKRIAIYASSSADKDAIETFSHAFYKIASLVETLEEQVKKNGDKLAKHLTPKNIGGWIATAMQKIKDLSPLEDFGFSEDNVTQFPVINKE
jgi:hypothetical protein